MKGKLRKILSFFNSYYFCILAVAALLIPDLMLRNLVVPKVYDEFFSIYVPAAFDIAWISLVLFGAMIWLPKKWGRLVFVVFGSIFIIFAFAEYVYFKIFEQFFRLIGIGLAGEGGDYFGYAVSYIDKHLIISTLLSIALLVVAAIRWKRPEKHGVIEKSLTSVPVLVLVLLHIYMQPSLFGESAERWDAWKLPRVVYKQFNDVNKSIDVVGIYHFVARDFYKTWISGGNYSDEDYQKVEAFFAKKEKNESEPNDYTGLLKGKNVIAVMLEGIDDWMIDEKYTPAMKYMMDNGISFRRHYAPTFGTGYTLGTEFCFNTGYYTPISAVSSVNYVSNRFPYALPQLFKEQGYTVNSFHYNHSEFYNRGILHKSLGYEKYHSFQDYGLPDYAAQSDSNILKTEGIYEDMIAGEPFFSFVITYSGHIPYTYDDAKLARAKENHPELVDTEMDFEENACRILAADTDDFFRQLLENLDRDGLLKDTAIVVYTDHYAYGYSDQEKLLELNAAVGDYLMYRVPAFVYSPGIKPLEVWKVTQTADLMPTVINLFGLENHYSYIGRDALSPSYTGFAYFSNAAWMDSEMYYDPADEAVAEEQKEQVEEGNKRLKELFDINDIVIMGDYFAR